MTLKELIQRTDFQQGFSKEGAELLSRLWVPAEEQQEQQEYLESVIEMDGLDITAVNGDLA